MMVRGKVNDNTKLLILDLGTSKCAIKLWLQFDYSGFVKCKLFPALKVQSFISKQNKKSNQDGIQSSL